MNSAEITDDDEGKILYFVLFFHQAKILVDLKHLSHNKDCSWIKTNYTNVFLKVI